MKIPITQNTKFHSALTLANRGNYFEALCLFSQTESYESLLNQIACLCEISDIAYAFDIFYYTKQKYGNEYAVYKDIDSLDGIADEVLNFCEPNRAAAIRSEGKKRADKSLLIRYDCDDDYDDFPAPDLNYMPDSEMFYRDEYVGKRIFNVKSEEYYDYLRINMERCYVDGNEAQANKYAKQLLALDTDHLPTLEAQISLSLFQEKFKAGAKYAERLANTEGASHAAIGGAIEILMRGSPKKHLDALRKLLTQATKLLDDVTVFDMEDYVYIATEFINDIAMANVFAEALFDKRDSAGLEALRICAYAFYNVGNISKSVEAATLLCRAVPNDATAKVLKEYLLQVQADDITVPFKLAQRHIRHYVVSDKIALYAQNAFLDSLRNSANSQEESNEELPTLDEKELTYLSVVISWCKSILIDRKSYFDNTTFIRGILHTFLPKENSIFFDFAKKYLFGIMCDHSVSEFLLARMLFYGYTDCLYISLPDNTYYKLDCGAFANFDKNELFVYSFSVCATLLPIASAEQYRVCFDDIVSKVQVKTDDAALIDKLAYAMMALNQKNFEKSPIAERYEETERTLLKEYLDATHE